MTERTYDGSLAGLFSILDEVWAAAASGAAPALPDHIRRISPVQAAGERSVPPGPSGQGDLFGENGGPQPEACFDVSARSGAPFPSGSALTDGPESAPTGSARDLYAVSADAFDAFAAAWMSELPIEAEIVRFGFKTLAAARWAAAQKTAHTPRRAAGKSAPADWTACEEARLGAARQAHDRGDADVRAVLAAAYKAAHEIDRMRGFLRFSPNEDGVYVARCAPDHFVLPALAFHFTRRFGEQAWAIIDEKRGLCLSRNPGEEPRLFDLLSEPLPADNDPWTALWRHYHRTINNESRKNPQLQRQFMPERYWKYLPELNTKTV
ncbi:hypothetical protein FACS189485_11920 [Spirochaetia bacterium]|nr:hypothetical protein FACS189485_11920 [Spirochaetia bacterium]